MSHGVRSAIAIREAVRRGELPPVTTGWVHPFDWVDIIREIVPWRKRAWMWLTDPMWRRLTKARDARP